MTCQQVQTNLSFYLYSELEFAQEEALERHLEVCALCQRALSREKEWHASLNSVRQDPPFDLLSDCRRDLRLALSAEGNKGKRSVSWRSRWFPSGFSATRWSAQIAMASFLLFVGFTAGRMKDAGWFGGVSSGDVNSMGVWNISSAHVRDIQPAGDDSVRILVDRVQQQEVTGRLNDEVVRRLLLAAMQDSSDPGIRVDSVQILQEQTGSDVRDALLISAKSDPNAAVRIKALEGLRRFTQDAAVRHTIEMIVQHDSSPEVRSEAIDILLPSERSIGILAPDVLTTLEDILNSERQDDYVRSRSLAVLRALGATSPVY